ncbi:MAG: peptidylprolyl isomerase [Prevotella sp.]|nr:peptidylprolyl isomerase [Prevotella sp.]
MALALPFMAAMPAMAQTNEDNTGQTDRKGVIDEVVWVVGDEAILRSDVETMRQQMQEEGVRWTRDPDCMVPEQLAVQKLFLHQAAIDSIEVTESEISSSIDRYIDYWISEIGSREKLEEYKKASITQLRAEMHDPCRDRLIIERMRETLVKDIKVSPAEVRRYFKDMPADSLPYIPVEVEVQIITHTPEIEQEEINRVKNELRDYTERITKGESSFSTLARLYSEDPGSARYGGELDYAGRGTFDPAFAAVAFNLTDPKKISKIVESEFGYHIIQLIDKRGDKIKVRHILKKPIVSDSTVTVALNRLDSIRTDINDNKFTFEQAASVISDDKDTRSNHGLMAKTIERGLHTSKFQMQDLPPEIGRIIDTMQVGAISQPFKMTNNRGKTVCAIVKLKNRIDGHKATVTEDFQVLKNLVLAKRREQKIHDWVVDKIKNTYVRVNDKYKNCDFEYQGWIK